MKGGRLLKKSTLSDELTTYGYVFSMKKSILMYALAVAAMFLLGKVFRLNNISIIVLSVVAIILLPFFIRNHVRNKYIQRQFSDLNIYMEQFLYSFRKSKKVLAALKDVEGLFEKGEMKDTIASAIHHIEKTFDEKDVVRNGLKIIEDKYDNDVLRMIHRFALEAESLGGDCDGSVTLLLSYRRMWADRVYDVMNEKKKNRRDIILSIIVSLVLCSAVYVVAQKVDVDFSSNIFSNIVTSAVLILDLLIFYKADTVLSANDELKKKKNDEELLKQYERIEEYNDSFILDRIAKKAAMKSVTRALEEAFPEWLMQVSLLLQTENVQVAIMKSYKDAPPVMKPALKELIGGLKKEPDSINPYLNFLSEYTLPEVRSSMKMLYSLSIGSGGDFSEQIADFIRRNQSMNDKAERNKSSDRLSGMYALFLAPQITGGAKLVCDMVLLFVMYLASMQGVGL